MLTFLGKMYSWTFWWWPRPRHYIQKHARAFGIGYLVLMVLNILTFRRQIEFWNRVLARVLRLDEVVQNEEDHLKAMFGEDYVTPEERREGRFLEHK